MMLDEQQVQQLLRLKRFEQPPPGYFDQALQEFHRRQRAELLRRSVFRIWWERTASGLFTFRVARYAYAAAFAIFCVLAALVGFGTFNSSPGPYVTASSMVGSIPFASGSRAGVGRLTLNHKFEWADRERGRLQLAPSVAPSNTSLPRYVLDGRHPVSTEVSFTF
jgi:hypothetical protein